MFGKEVFVETRNGVATVTLNRPDVLNALGLRLCEELVDACRLISSDRQVRVVILQGAGGAFCAGANLKERKQLSEEMRWKLVERIFAAVNAVDKVEIPVIAAIQGYALGGGTELAAACDLRVAAETAVFGLPEVRLGIIPGGGAVRLARLIGRGKVNEIVLTGRQVSAGEAERMGFVDRLVPASELPSAAQALADQIRGNAPLALRAAKRVIRLSSDMDLATALELAEVVRRPLDFTKDCLEGLAAFEERREPRYLGE